MHKIDFVQGMKINSISKDSLLNLLKNDINQNILDQHISITNTEAMYIASRNKEHFEYINNSRLSLCDGVGIKIAHFFKFKNIIRYNGPDMFIDVIENSIENSWSHFFIGGGEGIAEKLKSKLEIKYKGIKIKGTYTPPFSKNPKIPAEIISKINHCKPNFIWVSLGLPKGEQFIMRNKKLFNCNYLTHIGAAFDFHTQNIKRSPKFFRILGLEWFYRVLFEPRMIPRIYSSFMFMFKAIFK